MHDILQTLQSMGVLKQINEEELLAQAQQEGLSLEAYLLNIKMITHSDLAKAYSMYYALPLVEFVTEEMADPILLSKIQFNFLEENKDNHIKIMKKNYATLSYYINKSK